MLEALHTVTHYNVSTSVFITGHFIGFHRWPDAPDEVGYLRARHRHCFATRIDVGVAELDRQIEYHMLKRAWTEDGGLPDFDFVNPFGELELGDLSCERIAARILDWLQIVYPDQPYYRVEVSEDGENGSVIEARS